MLCTHLVHFAAPPRASWPFSPRQSCDEPVAPARALHQHLVSPRRIDRAGPDLGFGAALLAR